MGNPYNVPSATVVGRKMFCMGVLLCKLVGDRGESDAGTGIRGSGDVIYSDLSLTDSLSYGERVDLTSSLTVKMVN